VHVAVGALLRGLAGGGGGGSPRTPAPRAPASGEAQASAMEAAASMLGPPRGKFVPPCRMLTPAPDSQAPAQDP
jgi:hypothetical protein